MQIKLDLVHCLFNHRTTYLGRQMYVGMLLMLITNILVIYFFNIFQDETPLFLGSKEGSYNVCQILLDHYANRNITDHMDRLPRDVALERRHHDIVQLLDQYKMNSPTPLCLGPTHGTSPAPLAFVQQGKQPKQTKRRTTKQASKASVVSPTHTKAPPANVSRSKPRKKRATQVPTGTAMQSHSEPSSVGTISPGYSVDSHSPPCYDITPPPRYENAALVSLHQQQQQQQQQQQGGRSGLEDVTSVPQPVLDDYRVMNAHYSNPMDHFLDWPLHPQQQLPPPVLPKPKAAPSPPNHAVPSPIKAAKTLPTSPTHIQAMQRAAQQQQHSQLPDYLFHAPSSATGGCDSHTIPVFSPALTTKIMQQQLLQQQHHQQQQQSVLPLQTFTPDQYPTPPSQHSHQSDSPPQHIPTVVPDHHYLTPSPDSPGQWSSCSPHSAQSDWSEGISSPVPLISQVSGQTKRVTDPVYL